MVADVGPQGRVTLAQGDRIVGVVLRSTLRFNEDVKVRPTNTTAAISIAATTVTGNLTEAEREMDKIILLYNGPQGGFTQEFVVPAAGEYVVSDNISHVTFIR